MAAEQASEEVPRGSGESVPAHFSLGDIVKRPGAVMTGRVLRTDRYGVFVQWGDGPAYSWPPALVLVSPGEASMLRGIVRFLHPDEAPDPITTQLLRDEVGERAFMLFCEVIKAPSALPHFGRTR